MHIIARRLKKKISGGGHTPDPNSGNGASRLGLDGCRIWSRFATKLSLPPSTHAIRQSRSICQSSHHAGKGVVLRDYNLKNQLYCTSSHTVCFYYSTPFILLVVSRCCLLMPCFPSGIFVLFVHFPFYYSRLSSASGDQRETTFMHRRLSLQIQVFNLVAFPGIFLPETMTES